MSTPTVPVTVDLAAMGGPALAGITVRATLDGNEVYTGIVVAKRVEAVTDASGVAILNLFPNAPAPTGLGTQGTTYRFTATVPGGRGLNVDARVPNTACRLENILVLDEIGPISASELALLQAQAVVATAATGAASAAASAAAADADATQTAADRVQTALDRVATAADRVQTAADRVQTGLDRAQTGADRVQTGLDRSAASASELAAASSQAQAAAIVLGAEAPWQLTDYTALRAYAGGAKTIQVTGYLVTAAPSGIAGLFTRDDSDTTSADNGGTTIVASNGKRWKRVFDTAPSVKWWGATGDGVTDDRVAVQAAIAAVGAIAGKKSLAFSGSFFLGARTRVGSDDAELAKCLDLQNITDLTLISEGAELVITTNSQVLGYNPLGFRLLNSKRIRFEGDWKFRDKKTWSPYANYGGTGTNVPANWSGFSGFAPIMVYDGCEDIQAESFTFINCRYGFASLASTLATPPALTSANRTKGIQIGKIYADYCEYPFLLAENGDMVNVGEITTSRCMRPFFVYGVNDVKADVHVYQSVLGFKSSIARKASDTGNIHIALYYHSTDGYPYTPAQFSLEPAAGTEPAFIENCSLKLFCRVKNMALATSARQNALLFMRFDTGGSEVSFSAAGGSLIRNIDVLLDKGEFELPVAVSPTTDSTTNYKKLKLNIVQVSPEGNGTYNVPLSAIGSTSLAFGRKTQLLAPSIYEFRDSSLEESGASYPISGWAPWQNSSLASLASHGTINWRWVRIGALLQYECCITVVTANASLPAGSWYFQPPYFPSALGGAGNPPFNEAGTVTVKDTSTGDVYVGALRWSGATSQGISARLRTKDAAGVITAISQDLTKAAPFALDTGDVIHISLSMVIGDTL